MSEHFDFFNASLSEAQELVKKINWEHAFDHYHVLNPYIQMLPSRNMAGAPRKVDPTLAEKLHMILDLPLLRKPKFKDTCSSALLEVCLQCKYLESNDAVSLAGKLIQCGADVNYKPNETGSSCLQEAKIWSAPLCQLLIDAGATFEKIDVCSPAPVDIVELQLEKGASWKEIEPHMDAYELHDMKLPVLKALIKTMRREGFAIDSARWDGSSMLHIAAEYRDSTVLGYLIPLFPDISLPDDIGQTALMKACVRHDEDAEPNLLLLLKNRASVDASDSVGKTALMWAIERTDKKSMVGELLKRKPDMSARDGLGNTALHYCAARRDYPYLTHALAQMLLDAGVDVNATNSFGQTALMLLSKDAPKAVAVLVQGGAALDIRDHSGCDVFAYAGDGSKEWLSSHSKGKDISKLKNSPASPAKVEIQRSQRMARQIAMATALRDELAPQLTNWLSLHPLSEYSDDDCWDQILLAAKLGSEGIRVNVEQLEVDEVNRMDSMLSGPFYLSRQYPMVKGCYPLVQLDLRLASQLCGKALGDGLLQLWDASSDDGPVIRVIPREAVTAKLMTPFDTSRLPDQMETGVPVDWNSDPAQGVVQVFKSYESGGFQTDNLQDSVEEVLSSSDEERPPSALLKLIKRFHASLENADDSPGEIQLFGRFYPVQSSLVEIGKHLLFTIPYYVGSAQVFYEIGKADKVKFSSYFTTR